MQTSLSPSVSRAFLGCQIEKAVDELNLTKKIISCHPSTLPLPDHVDCFIALNRSPSRLEFSEALLGVLSLVTILSGCEINNFAGQSAKSVCYNLVAMFDLFRLWLGAVLRLFRTRRSLMLENLALRQQLAVFKRQQPRPRLGAIDKLFWVVARRLWAHWKKALLIVLPDTVARWHRAGFKLYWAMLCKVRNPVGGGRRISQQIRALIFQMVADNPSWGAPRIHGELLMLGFDVSETTISRWVRRAPRPPDLSKRWLTFLRNHREAIAAMDFFTVPTLTFGVLYCFFVIGMGSQPIRTAFRSPWQNGIAERWVGSVRRDLL